MRLWSLSPSYLDARGLVALWREGLLAQKVLKGQTRGYRNHPQLIRFKSRPDPVAALATYLEAVWQEANRRGYHFDEKRLYQSRDAMPMLVTSGQLEYELTHLRCKLALRDPVQLAVLDELACPKPHPHFTVIPGPVAQWEVVKKT
ncbi:pyrimidine dimer DNA glycosylase/endonuclease V [Acidihalobacter prosperus]